MIFGPWTHNRLPLQTRRSPISVPTNFQDFRAKTDVVHSSLLMTRQFSLIWYSPAFWPDIRHREAVDREIFNPFWTIARESWIDTLESPDTSCGDAVVLPFLNFPRAICLARIETLTPRRKSRHNVSSSRYGSTSVFTIAPPFQDSTQFSWRITKPHERRKKTTFCLEIDNHPLSIRVLRYFSR